MTLEDFPIKNPSKNFPICQHRTGRFCGWTSQRIGRLYSVTPLICNLPCWKYGPHNGKEAEDEKTFLAQMWNRNSPLGDQNLARRVVSNYSKPADIHVPKIWPEIQERLGYLSGIVGFRGVMLTGSVILRRDAPLKDLDIVLKFDNVASALVAKDTLPKTIGGIKTDFFFYIGDADVYFACLDCEERKLYLSRWLPLKIASIDEGIEVIERGTNEFGAAVKAMLEQEPVDRRAAMAGWRGVRLEWERLTSFVAAARSRGIMATAKHVAGLNNSDGFHCDAETLQKRQHSCFGDESKPACALLVTNAAGHRFCGACGCGETEIARLDADTSDQYGKLHYPHLRCPLNKEGFTV